MNYILEMIYGVGGVVMEAGNLFPDPTFDSGISGWNSWDGAVLSHTADKKLLITNTNEYGGAYYAFTTVIGVEYRFKAFVTNRNTGVNGSNDAWIARKTDATWGYLNVVTGSAPDSTTAAAAEAGGIVSWWTEVVFTATATTSYCLVNGSPTSGANLRSATIDNVGFFVNT